jgi:hypothetical protein
MSALHFSPFDTSEDHEPAPILRGIAVGVALSVPLWVVVAWVCGW